MQFECRHPQTSFHHIVFASDAAISYPQALQKVAGADAEVEVTLVQDITLAARIPGWAAFSTEKKNQLIEAACGKVCEGDTLGTVKDGCTCRERTDSQRQRSLRSLRSLEELTAEEKRVATMTIVVSQEVPEGQAPEPLPGTLAVRSQLQARAPCRRNGSQCLLRTTGSSDRIPKGPFAPACPPRPLPYTCTHTHTHTCTHAHAHTHMPQSAVEQVDAGLVGGDVEEPTEDYSLEVEITNQSAGMAQVDLELIQEEIAEVLGVEPESLVPTFADCIAGFTVCDESCKATFLVIAAPIGAGKKCAHASGFKQKCEAGRGMCLDDKLNTADGGEIELGACVPQIILHVTYPLDLST